MIMTHTKGYEPLSDMRKDQKWKAEFLTSPPQIVCLGQLFVKRSSFRRNWPLILETTKVKRVPWLHSTLGNKWDLKVKIASRVKQKSALDRSHQTPIVTFLIYMNVKIIFNNVSLIINKLYAILRVPRGILSRSSRFRAVQFKE